MKNESELNYQDKPAEKLDASWHRHLDEKALSEFVVSRFAKFENDIHDPDLNFNFNEDAESVA